MKAATSDARRFARVGSVSAYPVTVTVAPAGNAVIQLDIFALLAGLRVALAGLKVTVVDEVLAASGRAKVMIVGADETLAEVPLAAFLAVTTHVPADPARRTCPLTEHPVAVPSLTRNVVDPPVGSPMVFRVNATPA
jgi:hypothetical protein